MGMNLTIHDMKPDSKKKKSPPLNCILIQLPCFCFIFLFPIFPILFLVFQNNFYCYLLG